MVDQEKIHNQCLSDDPKERINALGELKYNFSSISKKQQAWNNLLRLTNDDDSTVRYYVAKTINSVFPQVPDKQYAWDDLHKLTNDEDRNVRSIAAKAFSAVYPQVPDEIKKQAWNDLHRLTNDECGLVRCSAASALGSVFFYVPDKQQAWNDLHRLTNDEDRDVRSSAAFALLSAFFCVPDQQQAWNYLLRLTNDEDKYVRSNAAEVLGSVFFYVPDQQQAWNDLVRLTDNEDSDVRFNATSELSSVFSQVPDKQQAWNDLVRLTDNEDSDVRFNAAFALSFAFSQVPDKQQAWNDLHRLTNNEDIYVRYETAKALGSVSSHILDKQQAWNDLHRLTNDVSNYVRSSSYHSLGRFSIFMASQAETDEDYKKELEKAIEFFGKAAQESKEWINPSKFCLPFYRSFHTIIFKKQEARDEVNKYLEEAKSAIEGSESKKQLFEAVENLAEALKEVQNLGNLDLQAMKSELNFYKIYCDHAAELMKQTDEKAPFATKVLRKGLPILDRNIKGILEEIQRKAETACQVSQGTATQEIACAVNREVQKWEIGNQEEMTQKVEDIAYLLNMKVADLPENRYLLNKIEAMKYERNLAKQYDALLFVIGQIPTMKVISEKELDQKLDQKFDSVFGEIIYIKDKLGCISFDISKIKFNSADILSGLEAMKEELEKFSKIKGLSALSIEKLDSMQAEKINSLNNNILGRLDEIKILIHELSKDNNEIYEEYSRRLDELKQSKLDMLLQRYSSVISLIEFVISGISIAR